MSDAVSNCILSTYSKDKFKTIMFATSMTTTQNMWEVARYRGNQAFILAWKCECLPAYCIYMYFKGLEQEELVVHLKGDVLLLFQLFM